MQRTQLSYYGPNEEALYVETDTPALPVLSDTFYLGWHATVDGRPVPIYQTNAALRGVLVPAGAHRVEMHFQPRTLQIGLGPAGAGELAYLAL